MAKKANKQNDGKISLISSINGYLILTFTIVAGYLGSLISIGASEVLVSQNIRAPKDVTEYLKKEIIIFFVIIGLISFCLTKINKVLESKKTNKIVIITVISIILLIVLLIGAVSLYIDL